MKSSSQPQPKCWDSVIPTTQEVIRWKNEILTQKPTELQLLRREIQENCAAAYKGLVRNADWTYSRAGNQ